MSGASSTVDLTKGIASSSLGDGEARQGRVGEDEVVLVRTGDEFFAVGAHCTHYHGPLAEGLVTGQLIRCPWHHACFDLRSGAAVRAPALDALSTWRVERRGDLVCVGEKAAAKPPKQHRGPASVVIVGGGAAGLAAADWLRREGYAGPVTLISADADPPVDRPNLSQDSLAGEAQDDWIPLRPAEFYKDQRIDLVLDTRVTRLKADGRIVRLDNGAEYEFGALLIATGAEPVHLPFGADAQVPVHYLRSFGDSRRIVAAAEGAKRAVIVGASFIGLEVAASLRNRGLEVDVVARDQLPLERVMGPEIGRLVRDIHEAHGVRFHLGQTVSRIQGASVSLSSGAALEADLVVAGVGVKPATELAERAGLVIDRGIAVNEFLETSAPGIYAAGDVARWLDARSGHRRRVEHWVVAERQGQVAAANMLGQRRPFDSAPFFWSQHYDMTIRYVGYAERWDSTVVDGDLAKRDCAVSFKKDGRTLAVATIGRDRENLRAEVALER